MSNLLYFTVKCSVCNILVTDDELHHNVTVFDSNGIQTGYNTESYYDSIRLAAEVIIDAIAHKPEA